MLPDLELREVPSFQLQHWRNSELEGGKTRLGDAGRQLQAREQHKEDGRSESNRPSKLTSNLLYLPSSPLIILEILSITRTT